MDPETILRVAPMTRQFGGWNDAHFHPQLRLTLGECNPADGIVVTLEAMARECVAVALSPSDSFQLGKTYVVHFGAANNVSTVIRRRLETGTEAVDVTMPSRVCSERSWISYWIAFLPSGKLYVGTGKIVGQQCIGCLDDSLYHQLRPGTDAVKFVGLSNSALGRYARPLKTRHVCVTSAPPYLSDLLQNLPDDLPLVNVDDEGGDQGNDKDEETKRLMEEYQKECKKNRARATKFGIPYKEPSPQAFLQWSQARRLRANPEKGFITGMDITTPEELAKQEARKARFGITDDDTSKKRKAVEEGHEEEQQEEEGAAMMDEDTEPLPVVQAWDNEELTKQHRTDPPTSLFVNPPPSEERREETEEFAMDSAVKEAELVPEKIHLFGIDWAAFKQIRTDDIMVCGASLFSEGSLRRIHHTHSLWSIQSQAYFSSYGPSYVEWLGELSCNVLFEDKFSAARALQHMSQELPSPPPAEAAFMKDPGQNPPAEVEEEKGPPDLGNMGWRLCQQPVRKVRINTVVFVMLARIVMVSLIKVVCGPSRIQ